MFAIFSSRSPTGSYLGTLDFGSSSDIESDTMSGSRISVEDSLSNTKKYELIINILKLKQLNPETDKLQFAEKVSICR